MAAYGRFLALPPAREAAAVAGAAGDRVPALPRALAEAVAGRRAEVAVDRFAEASAGRFLFPRADGSSSPTGCVMLHDITT